MHTAEADAMAKQVSFIIEIDKLKSIVRQSPLVNKTRRENSAEHSWHLAMCALILSDHADNDADVLHAIKLLLVHDIVEIDAGDAPIHSSGVDADELARAESAAADRIFGLLPKAQAEEIKALWVEFEDGKSPSARFAKALDRLQPLLLNLMTNGGTWAENNVDEQLVLQRYGPVIENGSRALWHEARRRVRDHFSEG
ncbi:MAG: HD domain-containing protein [Rhodospirillaceae bacterium]|jgi:putative hydrolases of HD superfamily|nr:HD domain-containing protein [Rhodospirillaceae bacterium]